MTRAMRKNWLQTQEEDTSPRLPTEVWENVIDELQDDKDALLACARVCRGWAARSRLHLRKWVVLMRPDQVVRLAKLVRTGSWEVESCRIVNIGAERRKEEDQSLRTLGLFALMFGGKMPRLEELVLEKPYPGEWAWTPGEMHVDVFLHLSTFPSITRLTLSSVTFPSAQTFGRLVSALPGLTTLRSYILSGYLARRHWPLKLLELDESGIPALVSSAGPSLHSLNLSLSGSSLLVPEDASIIDFSKLVNLRHLRLAVERFHLDNEDYLPILMPWIHARLVELPKPSTTLCDFTLQLRLGTQPPPEDSAVRHRSYAQHCRLLDDTLSSPPFIDLEQFIFEIKTLRLKAIDKAELQRLTRTRFPKLAARGVFRVVVFHNALDFHGIAMKREEGASYAITDLELP